MRLRILLTFTGFHDPYSMGLVGEEEQAGPILSLARSRSFDEIVLISTPNTEEHTKATAAALAAAVPPPAVRTIYLLLQDPTDYRAILAALRGEVLPMVNEAGDAEISVAVASGTPQMHACWLLLVASGELPAKILHVRPPKFVTKDRPLVAEVDLSAAEFPEVRYSLRRPEPSVAATDPQAAAALLGLVGDHPKLRSVIDAAAAIAPAVVPVLIQGETGTGKEVIARLIHMLSGRPTDRFEPINCSAIPNELVESTLFGHKRGAFTTAIQDQPGKFELADGGTLFLDEVGELPLPVQAKLLRVLEDGEVEPLGARKRLKVNVRVIAATHRNLRRMVQQGSFREDLYYRLNVAEIKVPPLRDRRSDIPKIALAVLDRINSSLRHPKRLSAEALIRLQQQRWPGNVRDLQNTIERSVWLCRKPILDAEDLLISEPETEGDLLAQLPQPGEGFSLEDLLSKIRHQMILRALDTAGGNQSKAARMLGISPQAVHKFLRKPSRSVSTTV